MQRPGHTESRALCADGATMGAQRSTRGTLGYELEIAVRVVLDAI